ncbi:hypothetical protein CIG19_16045 [Enterobacterales bacterium CwR94]|nr:hypothetical protein CIG19_16045 [Enterobacterales bacterium CwR94]
MTDMLGNRLLSAVKSQWISIHTPPPTIGCYLGINRKGLIQTLHYDGSAFFTETDPLTTPTITHWIPLPNKVDAK